MTMMPIIELNGKTLTQSYPMLRHFARVLGEYDGKTEDERYWVDCICDILVDWRTLFVQAFFTPERETNYPKHCEGYRKRVLSALEQHLSTNVMSKNGGFVLGDRITYADFVLYQVRRRLLC